MDPELPDTIVLSIITNLNTRFVVVALRTETIGEILATIKEDHFILFPSLGEVDVTAVEVDLLGGRNRISYNIPVRLLFHKELQGALFAQLTSRSNRYPQPPRLNLIAATELDNVPEQQDRNGHLMPSPPGTHAQVEEHDTPERLDFEHIKAPGGKQESTVKIAPTGASNNSNLRRPASDRTNRGDLQTGGHKSEAGEGQMRRKRKIGDQKNLHSAGKSQTADQADGKEIAEPVPDKRWIDRGDLVVEKVHEEPGAVTSKFAEKDSVVKSLLVEKSRHRRSSTDGSGCSQRCDPVTEKLHEESKMLISKPTGFDSSDKSHEEPKMLISNPACSDGSDTSGHSAHPVIKNVQVRPGMVTSKSPKMSSHPIESRSGSSSSDTSGSSSQPGPQTESRQTRNTRENHAGVPSTSLTAKEVSLDGIQKQKEGSKMGSLHKRSGRPGRHESQLYSSTTSGDTTCESSGQSENSRKKSKTLQGKNDHGPQNSGQEESEGDSPLQSSDECETENQKSSSEETYDSEQVPLGGRTSNRRIFGGLADLKYQHLLNSQDGFDELISLSQKKLKVIPGHQQENQLADDLPDSLSPVRLADDSLSIDLVPDTQGGDTQRGEGGDWNATVCGQDVQKGLIVVEPLEENMKETVTTVSTMENANASSSVIQKEYVPTKPLQDGVEDGENLNCRSRPSSSVKCGEVGELIDVKEEPTTVKGSQEERELESGEKPQQARSDDSQQMRAAVQLARLSARKGVDEDLLENSQSKKRMKRKKRTSSPESHELVRLQDATVSGGLKDQHMQCVLQEDGKKLGKSLVRDSPSLSLQKTVLSSPNLDREACFGNGNFRRTMKTDDMISKQVDGTVDGNQNDSYLAKKVASDAPIEKKKLGRRMHKEGQACPNGINEGSLEDVRGHLDRVTNDVPSQRDSAIPQIFSDAPASEEHKGKAVSLSGSRTHNRSLSASTCKAVKRKKTKRDEDHEQLGTDPENVASHLAEIKNEGLLDDEELHGRLSERKLLELQTSISPVRKKKRKMDTAGEGTLLENGSKVPVGMNSLEQSSEGMAKLVKGIEPRSLRAEVTSGQISRRASGDEGIGEGTPLVAENLTQESQVIRFKGETAKKKTVKEKRRLFVEPIENSSRPIEASKYDRDSSQDHKKHFSTSSHQDDFQSGLDKSPLQEHGREVDEMKGEDDLLHLDKNHSNINVDEGCNVESLAVARTETKRSRRKKPSPLSDQKAQQIPNNDGNIVSHLGDSLNAESEKSHIPQLVIENLEEANLVEDVPSLTIKQGHPVSTKAADVMPSTFGVKKTKKNREKSRIPKNHSEGEVAEEVEQQDGPAALGAKDDQEAKFVKDVHPIATDWKNLVSTERAEAVPSSLGKKTKTKQNHEKLKTQKSHGKPAVDSLAALAAEDGHGIHGLRTDGETPGHLTLKKNRNKKKDLELKPSREAGNRNGPEVQSVAIAGKQDDPGTALSPENGRKLSLKGSNAKSVKKRPRNREVEEKEPLPDQDPVILQDKKKDDSQNDETLQDDLNRNDKQGGEAKPAVQNKQVNRKKGKQGDSSKPMKRNALSRSDAKERDRNLLDGTCPHGCGKVYSKKTSSYYLHKRNCLSRVLHNM